MTQPFVDHADAAQQAAEEHIRACWLWLNEDGPEPVMLDVFCGCLTCEVRETLHAAQPHLRAMWEANQA